MKYALQFSNSDITKVRAIQQPAADKHLDQLTHADNGGDGPAIGKAGCFGAVQKGWVTLEFSNTCPGTVTLSQA